MPRLGYTKSRNGCTKCRQRRVKCDEKRPCANCVKHNVTCSLVARPGTAADSKRPDGPVDGAFQQRSSTTPGTATDDSTPSQTAPPDAAQDTNADPGAASFGTTDLELVHHFTLHAWRTLPRANEIGHVWRIHAFEAALSHDYLLHQILSFSALHLAHSRPDRRAEYTVTATLHKNRGIRAMRDELAHITSDNCHYVFAAGSFLLVSGFGELALRRGVDTTPQDLVDVFLLVRGMTFVVSLWGDTIHNGPFFDLFQMRDRHQGSEFHADMDRSLARLRIDLQSVVSDRSIGDVLDKEVANLAEQLEKAVVNAPVPELRVLMTWPGVMSDTYIQLLRSESPGAMVILAYYCVLAHRARADNWYTRTWGSAVLDSIQENLPPKWKPLIQWPVDYVQGERQPHSATHDRRAQT